MMIVPVEQNTPDIIMGFQDMVCIADDRSPTLFISRT